MWPRAVVCLIWSVVCVPVLVHAQGKEAIADDPGPSFWARHLNILQVEQISRFNYMDREPHLVLSRDVQYRIRGRAQWKLSESGSTYIGIRAENGRGFDNSWNNLGIGKSSPQGYFTIKGLFIGQRIGSHMELQAGGLEFEQGAGSQRSFASGDGVMTGYRLILDRVQSSTGFDRVSFTGSYVGDFAHVSVFEAFQNHLNQINYFQLIGTRRLSDTNEVSAEVDSIRGVLFTREALHWRAPSARVLDELQLELTARTNAGPSFGYAALMSRPIGFGQRLRGSLIFTDIPFGLLRKNNQPILLTQGEIEAGKRLSFGSSYALTTNLQISVFGGRLLDATPAKRNVAQVAVGYNYTALLNRLLH